MNLSRMYGYKVDPWANKLTRPRGHVHRGWSEMYRRPCLLGEIYGQHYVSACKYSFFTVTSNDMHLERLE